MAKHFKYLDAPFGWREYYSKYPHGQTIFEALLEWLTTVNDLIDSNNSLSANVSAIREELDSFYLTIRPELLDYAQELVDDMVDNGEFDTILTGIVQDMINATNQAIGDLNTHMLDSDIHRHIYISPTIPASGVGNEGDVVFVTDVEGSFTPKVNFGGLESGVTYKPPSLNVGHYYVIGKICFFTMEIAFTTSGVSGDMTIKGLPFKAADARPYSSGAVGQHRVNYPSTVYKNLFWLIAGDTSEMVLRFSGDQTTTWKNFNETNVSSLTDTTLRFQGFYFVD